MQKMMEKTWQPGKPVSRGAAAYHDAVINASWHVENVSELIRVVQGKVKDKDIVVDFGAGTGGLSFYFLKTVKSNFRLWLVDNSAAWLGKAYEILGKNPHVEFFVLDKIDERYATLAETVGENIANHVVSANTFHLIQDLKSAFLGINAALRRGGSFAFQSGNIMREGRKKGVLMIDDTVKRVHEIALELIRTDVKYKIYWIGLDEKIENEDVQRKFVFPEPRRIEVYLKMLKNAGFDDIGTHHKLIKVKYKDWLDFLRVKRLQAGILPEVGGKEPSQQEEQDRDELITIASLKLFKELESNNPFADGKSFTAEWVYFTAIKI
ncbi:class I SAM-dependent methyltransferase [Candidatus Woesearchaeota archaeon]|nr:class I SAM-dependent methyltransferase [Candidatus Woesearchaeota archaeon]